MILVNGKPQEVISVKDRGLAYGDGLFETIAIVDGEPLLWNLHFERLRNDCERLHIQCPNEELLLNDISQLQSEDNKIVIKIIVTRGIGDRGYRITPNQPVTRVVMRSNWPTYDANNHLQGIKAQLCKTCLSIQPLLAGMKHLNRLEQVLARAEWDDAGFSEGLMQDHHGHLIEGTMSNVFFVKDGILMTPVINQCGIAGVQRQNIINLARDAGLKIDLTEISIDRLDRFDEVFITNSLIGLWPVRQIDNQRYEVGPITRSLQNLLDHPQ